MAGGTLPQKACVRNTSADGAEVTCSVDPRRDGTVQIVIAVQAPPDVEGEAIAELIDASVREGLRKAGKLH